MSQRHEILRQKKDLERDERLQSPERREAYWNHLGASAAKNSLIELLESTRDLEGDVIECGVYRGRSLFQIAHSLKTAGSDKTIYACDSFEGFPAECVTEHDTTVFRPVSKLRNKFTVAHDVPARIRRFCDYFDTKIEVVQGYFSNTLGGLTDRTFSFIHLDVDLYESYLECLDLLYPRLAPGGVVVFDDYNPSNLPHRSKWPGAAKAIHTFFADRLDAIARCESRETPAWYVRKPAHAVADAA